MIWVRGLMSPKWIGEIGMSEMSVRIDELSGEHELGLREMDVTSGLNVGVVDGSAEMMSDWITWNDVSEQRSTR
jgi:hypothetical protein